MYNIIQQERLYGINYSIQQNIDILYTPLIVSGAIVLIFNCISFPYSVTIIPISFFLIALKIVLNEKRWKEYYHNIEVKKRKRRREILDRKPNVDYEDLSQSQIGENESIPSDADPIPKRKRHHIPQKVKDTVWNRDKGKCVECGSNENLEFDHIIPHSKGGANTYRNLQLLCQTCNLKKSDKIG